MNFILCVKFEMKKCLLKLLLLLGMFRKFWHSKNNYFLLRRMFDSRFDTSYKTGRCNIGKDSLQKKLRSSQQYSWIIINFFDTYFPVRNRSFKHYRIHSKLVIELLHTEILHLERTFKCFLSINSILNFYMIRKVCTNTTHFTMWRPFGTQ